MENSELTFNPTNQTDLVLSESGVKVDPFDTESTNEEAKATYLNELIRA